MKRAISDISKRLRCAAGVSLVELIIAAGLLLMVISAALLTYRTAITANEYSYKSSTFEQQARNALYIIARDLRECRAILLASTSNIAVLSDPDNDDVEEKVEYRAENGELVRDMVETDGSVASKTLARNLLSTSIFRYFDQSGAEITSFEGNEESEVFTVQVSLSIDDDPARPPKAFSTTIKVMLRNLIK